MVHSQLVIKIKLLRSEHGCLFSYPLCLVVDQLQVHLVYNRNYDKGMMFVQIHSSNYMNLLIQICQDEKSWPHLDLNSKI